MLSVCLRRLDICVRSATCVDKIQYTSKMIDPVVPSKLVDFNRHPFLSITDIIRPQALFGLPFLVRCPPARSTRYLWRLVVQQASRFVAGSSGGRSSKAGAKDRMSKAAAGSRYVCPRSFLSCSVRWR